MRSVRCEELFQSIDLIRQAVAKMPAGEIAVKVGGNPNGEHLARTEQPRGEVVYQFKANGTKNLQRLRSKSGERDWKDENRVRKIVRKSSDMTA